MNFKTKIGPAPVAVNARNIQLLCKLNVVDLTDTCGWRWTAYIEGWCSHLVQPGSLSTAIYCKSSAHVLRISQLI